jgi:predicted nucleotidyltransferase
MKMKNEVKNTIARSKTHICLEDEEKTKDKRNDEEDGVRRLGLQSLFC